MSGRPRLLVLGSSNTDMTVRLPRLPQPGQTVLGGTRHEGPGGKGANQAVAAARAGGQVVFLTALGDDVHGRQARAAYAAEGIDVTQLVTVPGEGSGLALIFVDERGENMIGVVSGANARLGPADVDRLPDDVLAPSTLVLVAGLEVPLAAVVRLVERANAAGLRVVLNPAPAPAELRDHPILHALDVLTPNQGELGLLTGLPVETPTEVEVAARALVARGPRHVVVTLGAAGCLLVGAGIEQRIVARDVAVVDTVGAGDAFNGALAVALAEGRDLPAAAAWANAAAALATTQSGAQAALPTRVAIDRLAATPAGGTFPKVR